MPEPIKNRFNSETIRQLATDIQTIYHSFQIEEFLQSVITDNWDNLELKERIHQISKTLGAYLPSDFSSAISIIDDMVKNYQGELYGFWIFPTFVEIYGQDEKHWKISINALAKYTQYSTSEFAVRPFIINHEKVMMAQMYKWAEDENEHVRRLASEGCRPQLPWGQSLPKYKKDPTPILPILEQLKADPSLYVRKSVANNLNDISKTNPNIVVDLAQKWYGKNNNTNWVIKHGCRTLLKKGNRDVLAIFGYHDITAIKVDNFKLVATAISLGEKIIFSFTIKANITTKIRLEYGIDYVKANGKRNRKIFQISETSLKENEQKTYSKNHAFIDLSTRKHYAGVHSITLIINGVEQETLDFRLL